MNFLRSLDIWIRVRRNDLIRIRYPNNLCHAAFDILVNMEGD